MSDQRYEGETAIVCLQQCKTMILGSGLIIQETFFRLDMSFSNSDNYISYKVIRVLILGSMRTVLAKFKKQRVIERSRVIKIPLTRIYYALQDDSAHFAIKPTTCEFVQNL